MIVFDGIKSSFTRIAGWKESIRVKVQFFSFAS